MTASASLNNELLQGLLVQKDLLTNCRTIFLLARSLGSVNATIDFGIDLQLNISSYIKAVLIVAVCSVLTARTVN